VQTGHFLKSSTRKRLTMKNSKIKLALICTKGGHFEQLTNLSDFYDPYDHFWITNRNEQTVNTLEKERKYFVSLAHFKKPWTYLYQLPDFIKIFARERPTHILSTGSGMTAFGPFVITKLLGKKFLYIDTFSRVKGYSKLGTFLLKTGQRIFSQWEDPENPNVIYIGPVFKKVAPFEKNGNSEYIFVTLGTREEPFVRLVQAVEELKKEGTIEERVIIQAGATKCSSEHLEIFDFCAPERIEDLIRNAKYVVTQESAGIGTICLKYRTRFLVMPRDYSYGELPAKSDMNEDLHFKLEEMGYTKVVNNLPEMRKAIAELDSIKTGFEFDNTLAIKTLNQLMEEAA
jgi:UDP-N-acetylglucosamine transferase subunit ALG13